MTSSNRAIDDILEVRARALAAPLARVAVDTFSALRVVLGDRRYAIGIEHVEQVLERTVLSKVPWAPPTLAGVTNVRGDVLLVADLGHLVGVSAAQPEGSVVILSDASSRVGVLVDVVEDLVSIPTADVVRSSADVTETAQTLVLGVTDELVVLDGAALLADPCFIENSRRLA